MKFLPTLKKAKLRRRYKRFLADSLLDGREITAHCPNPGSMLGHCRDGETIWLAPYVGGKLQWRWELAGDGEAITGVNTLNANRIVAEALPGDKIAELNGYEEIRPEQKVGGDSRLDFMLSGQGANKGANRGEKPCYVEVKSVTMSRQPGLAEFPDSPTRRGQKHLGLLARLAEDGHRAVMLFVVQRSDCGEMAIAADIDPEYAVRMLDAVARGVEVLVYDCLVSPQALEINRKLPFISE